MNFRIWRWFNPHQPGLPQRLYSKPSDCQCPFEPLKEGSGDAPAFDVLCSFVTESLLLGMYFLPAAVV